ncbi:hypothetical protein ACNKHQ_22595 [Shigella flexneri]
MAPSISTPYFVFAVAAHRPVNLRRAELTKWFNTNYHYMVLNSLKASSSSLPGPNCWTQLTKRWRLATT